MNDETFWSIIEQSRARSGSDLEEQAEQLVQALTRLPTDEVVAFAARFNLASNTLYSWQQWGAATVMMGWTSDDVFENFRAWVISLGAEHYRQALANPDTLADVELEDLEEIGLGELFAFAASGVYEAKTGHSLSDDFPDRPDLWSSGGDPHGELFERTESVLRQRYPRLAQRYLSPDGPAAGQLPLTSPGFNAH